MPSEHYYALPIDYRLGKFVLKEQLGQGNFGLTYLAWDEELDRLVAIKEMLPLDFAFRARDGVTVVAKSPAQEGGLAWARARFLEEARTLAKLQHPAIVQVYEQFEANSTAYLVMEYIEGEDLEKWLGKNPNPGEERLKSVTCKILEALQIVHRKEYLHRDIKPDNIRIRKGSLEPVLIDFGNARMATGLKTSNLSAIVTYGYAPFEQYQTSGKQGPWTDAYALGAVLYRAIVGKVPPPATDRHGEDTITRLAHNPSIKGYSPAFLSTIDKALRLRSDERWQTCGAWLAAIPGRKDEPRPSSHKLLIASFIAIVVSCGWILWAALDNSNRRVEKKEAIADSDKGEDNSQGGNPPVPASLISVEQPASTVLSYGQNIVDFGSPSINTTVTKTFVIRNIGQADLSGLEITKEGSSDFSVASFSNTSVSPGKIAEFTVTFNPSVGGSQKATLHVTSNSSGGMSPFDVNLTGGGVGTPDISIEQDGKVLSDNSSALDFGTVTVGEASELKFTIKSVGTADLAGLEAKFGGAAAEDYTVTALSSAPLASKQTVDFSVVFKPRKSGERPASLHIANNASGSRNPFDLSLTGSGRLIIPHQLQDPPPGIGASGDGPFINSIGLSFVPVSITESGPSGSAVISRKLFFSVYELRNKDITAWNPNAGDHFHPNQPVSSEAIEIDAFLEWLSVKEDKTYRLPTDHEWSCAVGISEKSSALLPAKVSDPINLKIYPWGTADPNPVGSQGNYFFESGGRGAKMDVGKFQPNVHGLFDMGGNVMELTSDAYSPTSKIARGGSFRTEPRQAPKGDDVEARKPGDLFEPFSSAFRFRSSMLSSDEIGFRIVVEP
jgi:serine/threonine protein kinase